MKKHKQHIGRINQAYLCIGCGSCVPICPVDAIRMEHRKGQYYPEVDEQECTDCGKCIKVCPGMAISVKGIAEKFWPENNYNFHIGRYKKTYIGYSTNYEIRFNSASGGIATTLIAHILKKRMINGAILTKTSENNILRAESFIARKEEEVIRAQTSKYCPTSPVAALSRLKQKNEREKFAFVGLPCQIQGLRKIQQHESWAKNKIILTVGLFCAHGVTQAGTEFLLNKFAKGKKDMHMLKHRGRGWPGGILVRYKNGEEFKISLNKYWPLFFAPYFFTPYRCLTCHDLTSELADVSLGDAWLKEVQERDKIGTSIIITRSELAENILNNMVKTEEIFLQKISYEKVIESQRGILARKKNGVGSRIKLFRFLFKPAPDYIQEFQSSISGRIGALLVFFNAMISKTNVGQKILRIIPHSLLIKYGFYVFKFSKK